MGECNRHFQSCTRSCSGFRPLHSPTSFLYLLFKSLIYSTDSYGAHVRCQGFSGDQTRHRQAHLVGPVRGDTAHAHVGPSVVGSACCVSGSPPRPPAPLTQACLRKLSLQLCHSLLGDITCPLVILYPSSLSLCTCPAYSVLLIFSFLITLFKGGTLCKDRNLVCLVPALSPPQSFSAY